jgi:hypothetical protein
MTSSLTGREPTVGTLRAFDARLLADASDPLVGTGWRVTSPARFAALESPRVDVVAASEERTEQGDLRFRRRSLIDRPRDQVHEVDVVAQRREAAWSFSPLCGLKREFCTRCCKPHNGLAARSAAGRQRQLAKGALVGISRAEPWLVCTRVRERQYHSVADAKALHRTPRRRTIIRLPATRPTVAPAAPLRLAIASATGRRPRSKASRPDRSWSP